MAKRTPDVPAYSRSGRSCLLGKRTVPLHTKVPEETAEEIRRLARTIGVTDSEFICSILMVRAHGRGEVERLELERLNVVSGSAQE